MDPSAAFSSQPQRTSQMNIENIYPNRRKMLKSMAFGTALLTTPGLMADELTKTPKMTEGPFYPNQLPLDTDNDLLILNDKLTSAVGTITHLTGKVVGTDGKPIRNATVEIWQVDNKGSYLHSAGGGGKGRDKHFQGFGRFLTGSKGEYYFRTIKPVPYPGRTPHIHVAVNKGGKRILATQLFIKDEPQNERDGLLLGIRDPKLRDLLIVDFKKVKDSRIGELAAHFDIVIGATPDENSSQQKTGVSRRRKK
jgi:protocatechuate 3,4-dioxygenase beta subunit